LEGREELENRWRRRFRFEVGSGRVEGSLNGIKVKFFRLGRGSFEVREVRSFNKESTSSGTS
jgi:hypothetical protein